MERGGGPSAGPLVPAHARRRPPGPSPASPRPASRLPAWSPPSPLTLSRVPPGPGGPTCRCHVPDSLAGDSLTARTPGTRRLPVPLCSQPLRTAATSPHPCKSSPWGSVVFYSGRLDRTNPGSGVPQGRATGARRPAGTARASGFCEPRLPLCEAGRLAGRRCRGLCLTWLLLWPRHTRFPVLQTNRVRRDRPERRA